MAKQCPGFDRHIDISVSILQQIHEPFGIALAAGIKQLLHPLAGHGIRRRFHTRHTGSLLRAERPQARLHRSQRRCPFALRLFATAQPLHQLA